MFRRLGPALPSPPMRTLLVAAAVALLAPTPPFPPPKLVGATPETRCDWGPISAIKPEPQQLVIKTDAGELELTLGPTVKIAAPDGRQLASNELRAGQSVRAYYVVDHGAKAVEIDVLQ
jgi:hypothetical protein